MKKFGFTLAEGATHVAMSNKIRRFAFTLAEVLITLAIIGIVAALTIPTLVANYQKKQWVSGLQKGYATMSNVFKMAMADDGVDNINQTSLWLSIPLSNLGWRTTTDPNIDYSEFVANLQKYMKINKFCNPTENKNECFNIEYNYLDGDDWLGDSDIMIQRYRLKIYAADGIVYYLRLDEPVAYQHYKVGIGIEIDVNGDNPPNQYGRDLFEVTLFNNGKLIFPGTKEWGDYIDKSEQGESDCNKDDTGEYCGARIFENGWKMDY